MTPEEMKALDLVFNLLMRTILAIGGIAGAVAAILALFRQIKGKTATGKLEAEQAKINEKLSRDYERLNDHDERIQRVEKSLSTRDEETKKINDALAKLGTALAASLNHQIDGNGVEDLRKQRDSLNEYFYHK